MIRKSTFAALTFVLCVPFTLLGTGNSAEKPIKPTVSKVPGVVINYSPSESGIYLGCPGIAILPNGDYVASHSFFGPASEKNRMAVFRSGDSGKTWQHLTDLVGQWWSTLFVHRGRLYIIGVNKAYGDIVIRRSTDGGKSWTEPKSKTRGLLLKGNYHCAPVPVVVHKGRIWRAFEEKGWKAFVMSAPADADLLKADNWTVSNRLPVDKDMVGKKWLEGNVVVTPQGGLVNILRTQPHPARAAVLDISPNGRNISFDAKEGIINFPGANKKFTIRYDRLSGKYWSLVNIVTDPGPLELDANEHRNTLALTCSKDLKNWEVRYIPLSFMKGAHLTPENNKFGFQYIDWLIEGDDIIFVSRTAWGWGTPRSHDANYFTFHRIPNFRSKTLSDKALYAGPGFGTLGLERVKYNNAGLEVDLGVGLWAWPLPMDYDGDGDNDLVVSCSDKPYNGTYFFENVTGDVKMPVFKPAVRIGKGYGNIQVSYVDGKARVLIPGKELAHFTDRKNEIDKSFDIYPGHEIYESKGRVRANQWKYCDYEGDGDLDLIVGVGDWTEYGWDNAFDSTGRWTKGPLHGYVYLILNNGTTDKPVYAEAVKVMAGGAPIDVYGMPSPNFADFDGDGDLDLICGEFVDKFTYFENVGTRTEPKYAKGRYLKYDGRTLTMDLCMIVPVALDWDKDGDVDLVVGQEDGRVALVENTGKVVDGLPQFLPPVFFKQQAEDVKFGALVTPCSFDWDGDGDEDLICGNTAGYIGFIENLDGGNPPTWAEPKYLKADGEVIRIMAGPNGSIQGPCEAKWGYTTLSVADWDRDGLADIVVNSIWGKVLWYRNIGSRKEPKLAGGEAIEVEWPSNPPKPAWTWWQPKDKQLVTQWRTTPVVIDLNKDGLNDLVMLDHEGYLAFFERAKKKGEPILLPPRRIFKNEAGEILQLSTRTAGGSGRRKLCFADWDRDGKLDLLVNSRNVNFFRNISKESGEYVFEDAGMVDERILAGHSTSPTVVDWDKNGVPDLLVGAEDGFLYYMRNPYAHDTGKESPNF
ncbi:MAG TPA: FG-GAP-like repeat-containing protein [Sedimentisphaerales bacterium]|nr:FG-GAP-like repeat-containing protein [Sedimentisphaerales bacterium]